MILFGIDRVEEYKRLFCGNAALITAPSGRTADNRSSIDRLREICALKLLLAPEHGVRGDKAAGELFEDSIDTPSGLPMLSLYSKSGHALDAAALDGIDCVIYDIQDVGCRYYTFISTLKAAMQACALAGKRLIILDRPDPLGGKVEGTLLQKGFESFVGCYAMPQRYGLTPGEFALMLNCENAYKCDVHIVPCLGLKRSMTFRAWGRPWIMPSLAMPRFETALLYPGTCLFEGTSWSEGRGTADPFAIIGAPGVEAESFSASFNALKLGGVIATPVYFSPYASKHAGQICGGLHLHIVDENALRPVEMGWRLIELAQSQYPQSFAVQPPSSPGGRPFISLLQGGAELEAPAFSANALIRRQAADQAAFAAVCEQYRLYQ